MPGLFTEPIVPSKSTIVDVSCSNTPRFPSVWAVPSSIWATKDFRTHHDLFQVGAINRNGQVCIISLVTLDVGQRCIGLVPLRYFVYYSGASICSTTFCASEAGGFKYAQIIARIQMIPVSIPSQPRIVPVWIIQS